MLAYATVGTNDLPRAALFYDALLAELGGKRFMEAPDDFIAWGTSQDGAGLGVTVPFDKKVATVGNGCMVALQASSREQVDRVYARRSSLAAATRAHRGNARKVSTPPTSATWTATSSAPATWGREHRLRRDLSCVATGGRALSGR